MARIERRQAPRIATQLPIAMSDGGKAFVVTTKDLSASGVYCQVGRFFPPMTKFQIKMELPTLPKLTRIRCQGVVVRTEPATAQSRRRWYHMALFFNDLDTRSREAIARYVHEHVLLAAVRAS